MIDRITKKNVLRHLQTHGRQSLQELIRVVSHCSAYDLERYTNRMTNTIGTLIRNHYLTEEVVQTGETKTGDPIFTKYYWDRNLYQKCKGAA